MSARGAAHVAALLVLVAVAVPCGAAEEFPAFSWGPRASSPAPPQVLPLNLYAFMQQLGARTPDGTGRVLHTAPGGSMVYEQPMDLTSQAHWAAAPAPARERFRPGMH